MTVSEMAVYSGFSASHFRLLFKKETGQTPKNFVAYLKVQKACHLLEFSDQKVSEIADQLGYVDSFYLSRVFSKVMGMSHTKFRKTRLS